MAWNSKSDINVPLVLTIVIVSALFLLVTVVAVDGWYKSQEASIVDSKWDESTNTWLEHLREQERANLADSHRINRQHRHVSVTEAMQLIANPDLQKDNAIVKQIVNGGESGS